jgi:SAM-dependent methyltransferase
MSDEAALAYTSERIDPRWARRSEADYLTYLFHIAAYRFAFDYTTQRAVLDYGCGTGYGTALLAESAASAVGIDIGAAAVEHAAHSYRRHNLSFRRVAPAEDGPLPFDDHSFDTVVSFQVIEHIGAVQSYLSEIGRVLRPGGHAVIATPDRTSRLFSFQRPWNRFHVTEYSAPQLGELLKSAFAEVAVLGMTATPAVIGAELRRTRRLRWMLLPFTLPIVPEALRRAGLGALKAISEMRATRGGAAGQSYGFDESSITIGPYAQPSANLIAVCCKAAGEGR